jgi:hypothetical protein
MRDWNTLGNIAIFSCLGAIISETDIRLKMAMRREMNWITEFCADLRFECGPASSAPLHYYIQENLCLWVHQVRFSCASS